MIQSKDKLGKKSSIKIIDQEGKVSFDGLLSEIPLKEEYILQKSMELFHEKEPCIIYRTHIIKKFHLLFYEELKRSGECKILCSEKGEYFEVMDIDNFEFSECTAYLKI